MRSTDQTRSVLRLFHDATILSDDATFLLNSMHKKELRKISVFDRFFNYGGAIPLILWVIKVQFKFCSSELNGNV